MRAKASTLTLRVPQDDTPFLINLVILSDSEESVVPLYQERVAILNAAKNLLYRCTKRQANSTCNVMQSPTDVSLSLNMTISVASLSFLQKAQY